MIPNVWKKILLPLFVMLLIFPLSFSCMAASLPAYDERDGNTYLGTFMISGASEDKRQFWEKWKKSDRNILLASNSGIGYYALIVPEGGTIRVFDVSGSGNNLVGISCSKAMDYLHFTDSPSNANEITPEELGIISVNTAVPYICYVVAGTYFDTAGFTFPSLSYDYLADDYQGMLYIVDDLEGESGDGLLGWLKNLWGWLTSFWETLVNTLKRLFVPDDGYLTKWVNDIKAAFGEKTGGITSFVDQLQSRFEEMRNGNYGNSTLTMTLPDNLLYPGYEGLKVDMLSSVTSVLSWLRKILNSILVILTIVFCERKLVEMIRN